MASFERRIRLGAPADAVWRRCTTPEGINDELWPVMRMTVPATMRGRSIADVAPGQHLGRSWFLLGGVVPFEYDDITIAELNPGRRFLERSTMLSLRRWLHERTVDQQGDGCLLTDRVAFELRAPLRFVPGVDRLLRATLDWLFGHRHRRLAAHLASRRPRRCTRLRRCPDVSLWLVSFLGLL